MIYNQGIYLITLLVLLSRGGGDGMEEKGRGGTDDRRKWNLKRGIERQKDISR